MTPAEHSASATIVVPCYNEARRLPVDAFSAFAPDHPRVQFLLVDDGSTDETRSVIEALAQKHPDSIATLVLPQNAGKAEAVRQGFLEAFKNKPPYVGFWDADLATPLEDIPTFMALLDDRPDIEMIFGSRVNLLGRFIQRKATRHYLGRIFATAASTILGLAIYDTQCGAKMFRVSDDIERAFQEPFISRWIFDVEIIARIIQFRRGSDLPPVEQILYEYPLQVWRDVAGSKIRAGDFFTVGLDLLRIYRRYMSGRRRAAPSAGGN